MYPRMVWSSDSDEDTGWTLEANKHRPRQRITDFIEGHEGELWNLYRCLLEKCVAEGYPFFLNGKLRFDDFVDFVIRHS